MRVVPLAFVFPVFCRSFKGTPPHSSLPAFRLVLSGRNTKNYYEHRRKSFKLPWILLNPCLVGIPTNAMAKEAVDSTHGFRASHRSTDAMEKILGRQIGMYPQMPRIHGIHDPWGSCSLKEMVKNLLRSPFQGASS